jgi:Rrf2 family protein
MKLSTRTRYGTRALLDLAQHNDGKPVLLKDIAQRQQIPLAYLEQLINPLVSAGILKSARGKRGGIWLAKLPEQIKLIEAFQILEGSVAPVDCLKDSKSCPQSGLCATQDIWDEMREAIEKVLESNTVQDLVEKQKNKQGQRESMYYI